MSIRYSASPASYRAEFVSENSKILAEVDGVVKEVTCDLRATGITTRWYETPYEPYMGSYPVWEDEVDEDTAWVYDSEEKIDKIVKLLEVCWETDENTLEELDERL